MIDPIFYNFVIFDGFPVDFFVQILIFTIFQVIEKLEKSLPACDLRLVRILNNTQVII